MVINCQLSLRKYPENKMSDPEKTGNWKSGGSDIANFLNNIFVIIFAIVTYVILLPIHDYIDDAIDRLYRWVTPEYDVPLIQLQSQKAAAMPQRLYRRQRTQTIRNASELEGLASRVEETARNQMSLSCGQVALAMYGSNPRADDEVQQDQHADGAVQQDQHADGAVQQDQYAEQETNPQSPEDFGTETEMEDVNQREEMSRQTTVKGGNAVPEDEQRNVWDPALSLLDANVGSSTSEQPTIEAFQKAGTSKTSSRPFTCLTDLRQHPLQGFSLIASPEFSSGQNLLAGSVFWEKSLSDQNPETNPVDGAIQQPDESLQTKDTPMEDSSEQILNKEVCAKEEEKEDSSILPGTTVNTSHSSGGTVWEAPLPELGSPFFSEADFPRKSLQQSLGAIGSNRKRTDMAASPPETAAASHLEDDSALKTTTTIPDPTMFPDPSGISSDPSSETFRSDETCEVDAAFSPAINVDATTVHLSGGTVSEATMQSVPSFQLFSQEDFNRIMSGVTIGSEEASGSDSAKSSEIGVSASASLESGGLVLVTDVPCVASPTLFSEDDFNKMISMQSAVTIRSDEPSESETGVGAITSHQPGGALLITNVPHMSSHISPLFSEDDFNRIISGQSSETTESEKPSKCSMDALASTSQQSSGPVMVSEVPTPHLFSETCPENKPPVITIPPSTKHNVEMKAQSYESLVEDHPSTFQRNVSFEEGETFPGSIERHCQGNRSSHNLRQKIVRLGTRRMPRRESVTRPTRIQRIATRMDRHVVRELATDTKSTETASSGASSSAANLCATTSSQRSLAVTPFFASRGRRKTIMPPQAPLHPTEFLEQRRRMRHHPQFERRLLRGGNVRARHLPGNRKRVGSPCSQPKKILKESPESEEDQRPDE